MAPDDSSAEIQPEAHPRHLTALPIPSSPEFLEDPGQVVWVDAPKWAAAGAGLALGWVAVVALPQLVERLQPSALTLLVAGGLLYSIGAIVYARRKPDPLPAVFGYHEVFHALTIAAAACQYVAIAFFVIRPA